MTETELRAEAVRCGLGAIDSVLRVALILHEGWDLDNMGWIVLMQDGRKLALTTNQGALCEWEKSDAVESRKEARLSVASIGAALADWPGESGERGGSNG